MKKFVFLIFFNIVLSGEKKIEDFEFKSPVTNESFNFYPKKKEIEKNYKIFDLKIFDLKIFDFENSEDLENFRKSRNNKLINLTKEIRNENLNFKFSFRDRNQ